MIEAELEKALRRGFLRNGTTLPEQAKILSEVRSILIGHNLLDNVREGHAEIVGFDEKGDLAFRLTEAGRQHVERELLPKLSKEEHQKFRDAAKSAIDRRKEKGEEDEHQQH